MTAIERVAEAGREAGLAVGEGPGVRVARYVNLQAEDGALMVLDADKLGRLIGGRRYVNAAGIVRTMPAADLEARALAWITEHAPAPLPNVRPGGDVFDELEAQYVAVDGFGTRNERHESPRGDVTHIVSGNATVGSMIGHVGVSFGPDDRSIRAMPRPYREQAAQTRARAYADDGQAAGVTLDRLGREDRVSFELGLLDPEEGLVTHAATLTRDQAEALYALLSLHFGDQS